MAKICIFNTQVDKDWPAQQPFESIVPVPPEIGYTKPVRLMNSNICSFEFIYSSSDRVSAQPAGPGGMEFTLYWWREFWGDAVPGSLQTPPSDRILAAVYPTTPWSREPGHVENPAGVITNAPAARVSPFAIREGGYGAALWVTTQVHAPWVRLAVQANAPGLGDGQLLINAHVGGHAEVKELDAHGAFPYSYNAVAP